MENTPSPTTCHHLVDRASRLPQPPADPLIARLDHAILSLGALAARPRFHAESRARAGLGREYFPDHPARRVDPALYGVLAALAGEGMPGPSSIAVRLGLSPSTVSHHLATLQRRGLVERRPYFGHRKWRDVELTPRGKDAYETLRDARHELLTTLLDQWAPDDRHSVVDAVARLGDAVRKRNLEAHERHLAKAREAALHRTPAQVEKARRYQRERYARSRGTR